MQWKRIAVPVLALLFVLAVPAHSQVAPSAQEVKLPLTIGAGMSDYLLDWGPVAENLELRPGLTGG